MMFFVWFCAIFSCCQILNALCCLSLQFIHFFLTGANIRVIFLWNYCRSGSARSWVGVKLQQKIRRKKCIMHACCLSQKKTRGCLIGVIRGWWVWRDSCQSSAGRLVPIKAGQDVCGTNTNCRDTQSLPSLVVIRLWLFETGSREELWVRSSDGKTCSASWLRLLQQEEEIKSLLIKKPS